MKKTILKLFFLSLLLTFNYLFVGIVVDFLFSNKIVNMAIYLFFVVSVVFYSGWVSVEDEKTKLWIASICGAIVYFMGEGVLKACYYFFIRNIIPVEVQFQDTFIQSEFFVLLFWGFAFSPFAALVAALGGTLKMRLLKRRGLLGTSINTGENGDDFK